MEVKISENISIYPTTKFWLLVLSKNTFIEYSKYKKNYLTCFDDCGVKKDDIIIIFCKAGNKTESGFKGLIQTSRDQKKNDKINIFKNNDLNKYFIKLKYKNIFTKAIKINEILNHLKTDLTGYKNIVSFRQSFRQKFLKNDNTLINIDPYGKKIVDKLIFLDENKNQNVTEEYSNTDSQTSSEKSNIEINSENDNTTEEFDQEEKPGNIPILVVPCKDFKLPNKQKEKYFVNHYKTCKKCNITNNNSKDLCSIIDVAKIEIVEIIDEKHGYFDPPLDDYFLIENHEPIDFSETPFIRVAFINNSHEIYDKCLLITWIN